MGPAEAPDEERQPAISGKVETLVLNKLDSIRISLAPHDTIQFHRDLQAFWSWASEGNSFAYAFDRNDRVDTTVNATLTPDTEKITNSDFNTWASDTDAGTWTETQGSGSGKIRREENLAHVYSGDFCCRMNMGSGSDNRMDQDSGVTLVTSTKYRLRVRAKNVTSGNKIYVRVLNVSTGNFLQNDETWALTTGVDNEPTFTPSTADFSLHELEFTTEGSGTTFTVRVFQPSSEFDNTEVLYLDECSIIPKQKVTLTSTDGVLVGNAYRLRETTGLDDEIVIVDAVDSATVIELQDPPKFAFASADIFRSVDYHPALHIPKKKQPFRELPTLVYDLDIRAEEFVS